MKHLTMLSVICICSISVIAHSQFTERKIQLSSPLNEISGLALVHDSMLVALNDSGNEPRIYFLDFGGTILHTTFVSNTQNHDWEDLTCDTRGNLYIADCGNNLNKRTNLQILKISLSDALKQDSVAAFVMPFHYNNQVYFPPAEDQLEFDCEAVFWKNDSIYLLTKSRSNPWKGIASLYVLPDHGKENTAYKINELAIGNDGWFNDAVTSADYHADTLVVLTYNRMLFYSEKNGNYHLVNSYVFSERDQKESIVCQKPEIWFLASEKHSITGGPFLYIITKQ